MGERTRLRDRRGRFMSPRFVWDDDGRLIRGRSLEGSVFEYRYDNNLGTPRPAVQGEAEGEEE